MRKQNLAQESLHLTNNREDLDVPPDIEPTTLGRAVEAHLPVRELAQFPTSVTTTDAEFDIEKLHPLHSSGPSGIPAWKWGIDRCDLAFFEQEVKRYYENGHIPESEFTEPPHAGAKSPNYGHDHWKIGPSMYQVNTHYIQPVTRAAGGMSWSLWRHPAGLQVDCFATHAWIEGCWEFIRKVRKVWPRSTKGLYVCFLCNPQFGVKKLLQGGITQSPFYLCLMHASHMIVIPNVKASIYKRKWCVYEAHLAVTRAQTNYMKIKLPWVTSKHKIVKDIAPTILLFIGGFILGDQILYKSVGVLLDPLKLVLLAAFMCSVTRFILRRRQCQSVLAKAFVIKIPALGVKWRVAVCEYTMVLVIAIAAGLSSRQLSSEDGVVARAERWPSGTLVASFVMLTVYDILLTLVNNTRRKQSGQLLFDSVKSATCTDEDDSKKIDEDIAGTEDSIDRAIRHLLVVGRYDRHVRRNLDLGMGVPTAADGINPTKIICGAVMWQFWWIADLAGLYNGFVACIPAVGISLLLFGLSRWIGEITIFAIDVFFWGGIVFLLISDQKPFFDTEAVHKSQMSQRTVILQAICGLATFPIGAFHYTGLRAKCQHRFHEWRTQSLQSGIKNAVSGSRGPIETPDLCDGRQNTHV